MATIGFEVQASVIGKIYHNNMPGLHLYTAVEFIVFSFIYYLIFKQRNIRMLLIANMLGFLCVAGSEILKPEGIWHPNPLARTYASVSVICYALLYLYFLFNSDEDDYGKQQPTFWFNAGALIYFGSNAIYFLLSKHMMVRGSLVTEISLHTHATLNIVANLLYTKSFKCFKQKVA